MRLRHPDRVPASPTGPTTLVPLCQADQSLVDIAVHLQDGFPLSIDIEHRAVDHFLAGRAPAAAGIDRIASAAKDIEGVGLVRQVEHIGRVELYVDAVAGSDV